MDKGVLAAVRRFPQRSLEIRRLAMSDGTFRSLCEDLCEAEEALARWSLLPSEQAASRRREYDLLVDELAAEIVSIVNRPTRAENG